MPTVVENSVAAAATAVVAVAVVIVVVAVANNKNDYQKNYPSTVAVVECVTHKMCLLKNGCYLNANYGILCGFCGVFLFNIYNIPIS